jgi:hypothetical protein
MCANSKIDVLHALRTFFRDLQHWEIILWTFDPHMRSVCRDRCVRSSASIPACHRIRLRQEIPLSEPEREAVGQGLAAYEELIANLGDVPTPDRLLQIEKASAMHTSESEEQC